MGAKIRIYFDICKKMGEFLGERGRKRGETAIKSPCKRRNKDCGGANKDPAENDWEW